jgi:hypothetical protein
MAEHKKVIAIQGAREHNLKNISRLSCRATG